MSKIKNTLSDIDSDIIICAAFIEDTKKGTIKRITIKTKEHKRICPHCESDVSYFNLFSILYFQGFTPFLTTLFLLEPFLLEPNFSDSYLALRRFLLFLRGLLLFNQ